MRLGLGLGWHSLRFDELLDVVQLAEARGYAAVYVDGDVSQIPRLGDAELRHGWTTTTALLARSERIPIGSIRLVHHWNAAALAQAAATLESLAPGRLRFLISVGGQREDRRFGLPFPSLPARIQWLDETLTALRALWRGELLSVDGGFVRLEQARVRPVPPGGTIPIEIAAARPRLLRVVAKHADRWDVNLPPLPERVHRAAAHLATACAAEGRDPAEIARSMWIFTRPGRDPADPELAQEYRRLHPWFADLSPAELQAAVVAGSPAQCRQRLAALAEALELELPLVDLSGLPHDAVRRAVEDLAP